MGLCFSKKQLARRLDGQPSNDAKKSGGRKSGRDAAPVPDAKKAPHAKAPAPAATKKAVARPEEPAAGKRTVFVVKAAAAAAGRRKGWIREGGGGGKAGGAGADIELHQGGGGRDPDPVRPPQPELVGVREGAVGRPGSKRSYDFDHERRGGGGGDECDWGREGAAASRPSPRRRTPERKRSASHDGRTSGGSGSRSRSRRVSRSPGRRADVAPAAGGSRKIVSVPARDKGCVPSPVKAAPSAGKRYPSPRSNSPARGAAVGNENVGVQPTHGPSWA